MQIFRQRPFARWIFAKKTCSSYPAPRGLSQFGVDMERVYSVFSSPYREVGVPTFFHFQTMPKNFTTITKKMPSGSTPGSFPSFTALPVPLSSPPPPPLPSSTASYFPHSGSAPHGSTEMPPNPVVADKLESEELVKLLEIIDKLREFGVSEDISLPQVCSLLYSF